MLELLKHTTKEQETQKEIDAFLASEKQSLKNRWMADYPDKNAEFFEQKVWCYLRENIMSEHPNIVLEARVAKLNKASF